MSQFVVPLSRLVASKHNPRKVKPAREAHRRLVALIKVYGLIHPLVVRPVEGKPKHFQVIAGDRRLSALKEIHRNDGDPKIPCVLRKVDQSTADALSLGENFCREPMHPCDEAEAFAKLASQDGKSAEVIAAEFGVEVRYVRQRMKLATLAKPIRAAYRQNAIDTATAEVFATVPDNRQMEVWNEVNGSPQHAQHVRNIIANEWIDASRAIFDIKSLPESAVSQDLFGERTLVERRAFMEAQSNAVLAKQASMKDDGWSDVIVGARQDIIDRLLSMDVLPKEYDGDTTKRLERIDVKWAKLEKAAEKLSDENADDERLQRLESRFQSLETEREELVSTAPVIFTEKTKAAGVAFLMLDPDGNVHTEYRQPRRNRSAASDNGANGDGDGSSPTQEVPTPDDLADRQMATTYTHQAILVREALLKNDVARRRVLALILHDKIHSDGLAIRHEANVTTLHASAGETFKSPAFDRLQEMAAKHDPFAKAQRVEDCEAYKKLRTLPEDRLDSLIDTLIVQCVTAHLQRETELIALLAKELEVNVRDAWKPDAEWLSAYQKIQLAQLVADLQGSVHAPVPERKKSELVSLLAGMFSDASDGKLDDKKLAAKLNAWQPSNLRKSKSA